MQTLTTEKSNNIEDRRPIILAEGIELLSGMNDIPLLYNAKRKSYIRLSTLAAEVMRMLLESPTSLTREDIEQALSARYPGKEAQIADKVRAFLGQLQDAEVIVQPAGEGARPTPKFSPRKFARKVLRRPMLRIGLWHPEKPLAQNLVHRVDALAGDTSKTLLGLWFMVATLTAFYVLVQHGAGLRVGQIVWPLVIGYFLLHLTLHELSHTLVSSYYGVRIREIGLALLYYILPVAYADRTDGYRLRDPRQRIHIALAGPAFDISAAAITAALVLASSGWLSASLYVVLFIEVATFISNLNPLMPSDGYHALEAAFGELNFRQRTFLLYWHWLTFRTLPAQLRALPARRKLVHAAYGLLMFGYLGLIVFFLLHIVAGLIVGVV
ncbi:MAG TPA: PqqD family peptide modification chaperone [Ktedonobacteraceae bacterium]|nr:PqqD family peptide modification chaperone [Ktedonobacteraceae bacterium]